MSDRDGIFAIVFPFNFDGTAGPVLWEDPVMKKSICDLNYGRKYRKLSKNSQAYIDINDLD
jgi:hypothetical protein